MMFGNRGPGSAARHEECRTAPGTRACKHWRKKFFAFLIPVPETSLILLGSCPVRGASRGDPEVGQSESWPEGQPEGRCGACGRASQARTREALGNRPGPLRGSAFNGWTKERTKAGESSSGQGAVSPGRSRKHGPKDRNRCDGASEGVPRPLVS